MIDNNSPQDKVQLNSISDKQRQFFNTQVTKELKWRKQQLEKLLQLIIKNEDEILAAVKKDLNKSELDAYTTEVGIVRKDIRDTLKNIDKWAAPQKVKTPITHFGAKSYIYNEPYGVALIIAPWNYPFQLAIAPLVGAVAAGNCAVLKPSEFTPNTSQLIAQLINDNFPSEYLYVAEGDVSVSTQLLEQKFDYVFFTGSVPVGRIVMQAAAKHLTPVTLELGGKSPCIVDIGANLDIAAKRIVWGKFLNAGQTCIAPDYLLVHQDLKASLLEKMEKYIKELYGEDPLQNSQYTRIVHAKHFQRLVDFIKQGSIVVGGAFDAEKLVIAPTILENAELDAPVMQEEIFGPILPVFTYKEFTEVYEIIEQGSKPLALYLFTENKQRHEEVLQRLSFGGGCINDTIMHVASSYLPFGGVGDSGMGAYHGKYSFTTFSHAKSIVKQTTIFDMAMRYPNFPNALKLVKKFMK